MYCKLTNWLRMSNILPMRRKDIIWYIYHVEKRGNHPGLCDLFGTVLSRFCKYYLSIRDVFPKFTIDEAKKFNCFPDSNGANYWWKCGDWEGDRMHFLNYLYDEYKNDKTKIRDL